MNALSDTQIVTMALAVNVPIALSGSAIIYSNSRINDAKETLRAEMALGFGRVLAAIKELDAKLESKLTIHELEHHRK